MFIEPGKNLAKRKNTRKSWTIEVGTWTIKHINETPSIVHVCGPTRADELHDCQLSTVDSRFELDD